MYGNEVDIGRLIMFSNSFVAILIVAFFIAKSVLIAIGFLKEVVEWNLAIKIFAER